MPVTPALLDKTFRMIEAAAVAGERCPQSKPFGPLESAATSALAHAGRIRIEVFMHNWRVITIMEGKNKGKQTQAHPKARRPYKVIYKDHVMIKPREKIAP